ncbi:hypothetical protein PSU4_07040 [Pseudonocardia sulfidoxydans NBRC 16205]|uniref:Uncharacterized protein n=2 Tax=Pseudonocardia sulfidoxydans TaxID=54011 RepID=A0A511DAB5_9PSEU|nr:hypothetical protein PSU4_07040 [Pseudonocardia sulfidoxydans NBRC 16205]
MSVSSSSQSKRSTSTQKSSHCWPVPHFAEEGMLVEAPRGGFLQPATPYRLHGKGEPPAARTAAGPR